MTVHATVKPRRVSSSEMLRLRYISFGYVDLGYSVLRSHKLWMLHTAPFHVMYSAWDDSNPRHNAVPSATPNIGNYKHHSKHAKTKIKCWKIKMVLSQHSPTRQAICWTWLLNKLELHATGRTFIARHSTQKAYIRQGITWQRRCSGQQCVFMRGQAIKLRCIKSREYI